MRTNWTHIDDQLRQFSSFFRDELQIDAPPSNNIATAMADEIRALDPRVVHKICVADPVSMRNRLDELVAFQAWMDIVHSEGDLELWQAVARCVGYVTFTELQGIDEDENGC